MITEIHDDIWFLLNRVLCDPIYVIGRHSRLHLKVGNNEVLSQRSAPVQFAREHRGYHCDDTS